MNMEIIGRVILEEKTCGRVIKLGQRTIQTTPDDQLLHNSTLGDINLHFSLSTKIYVWVTDDEQNSKELWRYEQQPLFENTFRVTRQELMSSDQDLHKTIKIELMGCSVSENSRNGIISHVLHKSRERVQSVNSTANYVLDLSAEYFAEKHRTLPRGYMMDAMMRSMQSISLVPAADSSIESLKSCDRSNCKSCSICLDEFSSGCEALCMPCSHAFHGDCIKRWLRTSHYCPLCRDANDELDYTRLISLFSEIPFFVTWSVYSE